MKEGLDWVKVKIGGMELVKEVDVVKCMREGYWKEEVEVGVDGNGGLCGEDGMSGVESLGR